MTPPNLYTYLYTFDDTILLCSNDINHYFIHPWQFYRQVGSWDSYTCCIIYIFISRLIYALNLFIVPRRGHSITRWTRCGGAGGRGSKNSCFCPCLEYKNCPRQGGGWVKKWQNSVHVVVEWHRKGNRFFLCLPNKVTWHFL